jgi:hypothetical protein
MRIFINSIVIIAGLYTLLLIPDWQQPTINQATGKPFVWDQDMYWENLEAQFVAAGSLHTSILDSILLKHYSSGRHLIDILGNSDFAAKDSIFSLIQNLFFELAPYVAAKGGHPEPYIHLYNQFRMAIKKQSRLWNMDSLDSRITLYRTLYGMRAALEEVLLQLPQKNFDPVMLVEDIRSATPSTEVLGIKVHSGDLLVSRGGVEVSALISRGNDYPGNFSHVAFIYIDETTNEPFLIEAHIEIGVAIATVDRYLQDKKLRFMVLRPHPGLPQLIADPLLPHKAAKQAYNEALSRHIPYDFKMDFYDPQAMFCSEVGSSAYLNYELRLWQAVSTISSQGVVNWLSAFGVENFVTQMPSDLEYDPQLGVVGEWRDSETLFKDHLDNAVMDVLLESANEGMELDYNLFMLPFVRILKGYYTINNMFGVHGLIPEGMTATQALKNNTFIELHKSLRLLTEQKANAFIIQNQYTPPYWQLYKMANEAKKELF